jgi:hypothetical protein
VVPRGRGITITECGEGDSVDDFVEALGDEFVEVSAFFSDQRGMRLPASQRLPGAGFVGISWLVTGA